jgi:hypothetical protein
MAAPTRTEVIAQAAAMAALKAQAGSAAGLSVGGQSVVPGAQAGKAKVPATLWVNIGYSIPGVVDPATGVVGADTFVSLPFGTPLDTMEHVKVNGTSEFAQLQAAKNQLLLDLIAAGTGMTGGTTMPIKLEVQMRKVAEAVPQTVAAGNPFARTGGLF